jgi:hypothetical protein
MNESCHGPDMPIPTDNPVDTTESSPESDSPMELDWDDLEGAIDGMESGTYVELSLEDVDLWAEASLR